MMKRFGTLSLAAATCAFVLGANTARAAQFDHLLCYKTVENSGQGNQVNRTAKFVSGSGEATVNGCTIKKKVRYCCDIVDKQNLSPASPGGGPSPAANKFCCYKLSCPRSAYVPGTNTFAATDQFGNRTPGFRSPKLLCAPSSPSGAFLDAID